MKKNLKICFTFIMSGHAHILISPGNISDLFPESGCKEYPLDPGHYFIFYDGASAGGCTMTISVDDVVAVTKTFAAGTFDGPPVVVTI